MPNFNSQKVAINSAIAALLISLYAAKFDLIDLNIPVTYFYILQKSFFALFPLIFFYFFPKIKLDKKIFIVSLVWSLYTVIQTYFYAINYMIGSIQLAILFTSILFLDKKQFIIMYSALTVGTALAIKYSTSIYGFGKYGPEIRDIYLDDFLSLQVLTGFIYFIVTYPRIKKLKEDLQFSNFGKASSFLLHEMQKPISRLKDISSDKDELESLRKTLDIAKKLQSGSLKSATVSNILIDGICYEVTSKYQEHLNYYNIKTSYLFSHNSFKSDNEMIVIVIDNLVRNAIEANKENVTEERWIKFTSTRNGVAIANPYTTMVDEKDLFTPLKSSKQGNMGTGLHFCKTISEGLNHNLRIKCKNQIFVAQLEF